MRSQGRDSFTDEACTRPYPTILTYLTCLVYSPSPGLSYFRSPPSSLLRSPFIPHLPALSFSSIPHLRSTPPLHPSRPLNSSPTLPFASTPRLRSTPPLHLSPPFNSSLTLKFLPIPHLRLPPSPNYHSAPFLTCQFPSLLASAPAFLLRLLGTALLPMHRRGLDVHNEHVSMAPHEHTRCDGDCGQDMCTYRDVRGRNIGGSNAN